MPDTFRSRASSGLLHWQKLTLCEGCLPLISEWGLLLASSQTAEKLAGSREGEVRQRLLSPDRCALNTALKALAAEEHSHLEERVPLPAEAAITKYRRSGWLRQRTFIFTQFWRSDVQDQGAEGSFLGLQVATISVCSHDIHSVHGYVGVGVEITSPLFKRTQVPSD